MRVRVHACCFLGYLALLGTPCVAQVPAESLAVWARDLRDGALTRRIEIVGRVIGDAPGALPGDLQAALVAELTRVSTALFEGRPVDGGEQVPGEDLGEYFIQLTSVVARLRTPDADRALILAVAVSGGVQRRVARLGDAAIPTLARMNERGYESGAALETMGLAWFWSDSTGALLSAESRGIILRQFFTASTNADRWLGLAAALQDARDPALLPFARAVERRAVERREIAGAYLQLTTIPALESALARLAPADVAGRTLRAVRAFCTDAASGPRRGACESVQNELQVAMRHLEAGRREAAGDVLQAVARRSADALASGAFSSDEHAIVSGGVEQILARL